MVPPDRPSDRELWRLASDGDGSAFGQLFDRHATAVYNHLFRRTANWSEAEDLTSAVFLLAWRKRGKVVLDRESALPWLLGIASHTARNAARASRRYRAALARLNPDDQFSADPADAVAAAVDSERRMAELRDGRGPAAAPRARGHRAVRLVRPGSAGSGRGSRRSARDG